MKVVTLLTAMSNSFSTMVILVQACKYATTLKFDLELAASDLAVARPFVEWSIITFNDQSKVSHEAEAEPDSIEHRHAF